MATLAVSTPAAAHDELVSSTPASGERLDAAPATVSLQFSADVLTIGAAVVVADAAGRDWVIGEPVIDVGTVSVDLDASMPVAGYEIRWRVVSADGHPISGLIPFTIGDAEPLVREAAPRADDTESAAPDQSAPQGDGGLRLLPIGIGGAALAVGAFALIYFIRRRRAGRGDDTDATD